MPKRHFGSGICNAMFYWVVFWRASALLLFDFSKRGLSFEICVVQRCTGIGEWIPWISLSNYKLLWNIDTCESRRMANVYMYIFMWVWVCVCVLMSKGLVASIVVCRGNDIKCTLLHDRQYFFFILRSCVWYVVCMPTIHYPPVYFLSLMP